MSNLATDRLRGIRPAVSMFGSARLGPDSPWYSKCETIARLLSDAGFAVISGGGPGLMEAANRGAHGGRSPAVGLTSRAATTSRMSASASATSSRAR